MRDPGAQTMISKDQFAEMNARLEEIEKREQVLVQALRERIENVDQKLLDDVRSLSSDHENRRTLIMSELQTLAERIGAFPNSGPSVETIDAHPIDMPRFVPQAEPLHNQEHPALRAAPQSDHIPQVAAPGQPVHREPPWPETPEPERNYHPTSCPDAPYQPAPPRPEPPMEPPHPRGDWRQAAAKIRHDLEERLGGRQLAGQPHHATNGVGIG